MNIIKFKDQIRPGDDLFNTYLKGKYAYLVHFRYAIPFDFMTIEQYVACENDLKNMDYLKDPQGAKMYWDIQKRDSDILAFVDDEATDAANNVNMFLRCNSFTTDSDITLEEIKKFRTWLAETVLSFDQKTDGTQKLQFLNEELTHTMQYYAGGMYDDVLKWLNKFGKVIVNISTPPQSSCGCAGADLSSLYKDTIGACDPIYVYKRNVYDKMVEYFSKLAFWQAFPTIFLQEFKAYIDNIIRANLSLGKTQFVEIYTDCVCLDNQNQQQGQEILARLSKALEYMIENQVAGNKNYINQAFSDWATQLYEVMEW